MTWPDKGRDRPRNYRKDRDKVLERADHQCQINGPDCTGEGIIDDHIVNLADGGTNDLDNRQAACPTCHGKKTSQEGAEARRAAYAKTKRTPSKHPGLK